MRGLNLASRAEDSVELDMTPLLDVVFIMLIFFIVTASFIKETGLDVSAEKSQQQTQPDPEKQNITVRIEQTGRIWVNENPTTIDGVQGIVKRLHAQNPGSKVLIQPDPKSKTALMIQVLDRSNAAGVPASIVSNR